MEQREDRGVLHLGEVDLSTDAADWDLPTGPSLLLVRDGPRPLGELRFDDPSAVDPEALAMLCAEAFAERLYACRAVRVEAAPPAVTPEEISVVVCTRDRADLLRDCLESLTQLDPQPGEILVIDNASATADTAEVARRAGVPVLREDQPGLDNARNRAWSQARGRVVAYVDDDARADRRLMSALAGGFFDDSVALVTGLVLPAEITTRAQRVFERSMGMRKGYQRAMFHREDAPVGFATHRIGIGAVMALRRDVLAQLGGFDPCLDVGTATAGAGDLELFHRLLEAGHVAVYEPDALVRHVHRRQIKGWLRQLRGYGLGYSAYLESVALRSPELRRAVRRERLRWHAQRHVWGLVRAVGRRNIGDLTEAVVEAVYSTGGARAYRRERALLARRGGG